MCSLSRRVSIVEIFAKQRLNKIMLDFGMDDLIHKIFHHFFSAVRKDHADNVIAAMWAVMVLVINKSDVVPQSLFNPIG